MPFATTPRIETAVPTTVSRRPPATDVLGDSFAVFRSHRPYVEVTRPVAQFLGQCARRGLRPILETDEAALLSPLLTQELQPTLGRWVVRHPGTLVDVRTRLPVDPIAYEQQQAAAVVWPDLKTPQATLAFEFSVFHRATHRVRIGAIIQTFCASLGVAPPDWWGHSFPLLRPWSVDDVTAHAQQRMPRTPVLRAGAARRLALDFDCRRTPDGVIERWQGAIALGSYDLVAASAVARATAALSDVCSAANLLAGIMLLTQTDDGVYSGVAGRRPPAPCAFAVGPLGIRQAGIDARTLTERGNVRMLGREKSRTLVISAPGLDEGWHEWADIVNGVGFGRVWSAAGGGK